MVNRVAQRPLGGAEADEQQVNEDTLQIEQTLLLTLSCGLRGGEGGGTRRRSAVRLACKERFRSRGRRPGIARTSTAVMGATK